MRLRCCTGVTVFRRVRSLDGTTVGLPKGTPQHKWLLLCSAPTVRPEAGPFFFSVLRRSCAGLVKKMAEGNLCVFLCNLPRHGFNFIQIVIFSISPPLLDS